jgi:hypothetical protein
MVAEYYLFNGKRDYCKGQTGRTILRLKWTAKGTLLLGDLGLTHIG